MFKDDDLSVRVLLAPQQPCCLLSRPDAMNFTIKTHDSWGIVKVGSFQSLEEARKVFSSLCEDPWYKSDGMVKGVELLQDAEQGEDIRMDWFAFQ